MAEDKVDLLQPWTNNRDSSRKSSTGLCISYNDLRGWNITREIQHNIRAEASCHNFNGMYIRNNADCELTASPMCTPWYSSRLAPRLIEVHFLICKSVGIAFHEESVGQTQRRPLRRQFAGTYYSLLDLSLCLHFHIRLLIKTGCQVVSE